MSLKIKAYNIRKFLSKSKVDVAQSVGGLEFPGRVASAAIGTAQEVGEGNIIRIVVTTAGRIAFGDSGMSAPSGAVDEVSLSLPIGIHYVFATGDYIRSDGTLVASSVEVLTA